jgi:LmbE family N-acetylglucosaminyl deacetylase
MKQKVLIIEPHSDDSYIGAGGFFLKNRDQYDFYFCLVAASDIELHHRTVTREERLAEYQQFVEWANGTWVRPTTGEFQLPLDFDSKLDLFPRSKLVKLVENAIMEIKPDIIMTMGPSFHIDHTTVYEAVIAATRPTFNYCPKTMYILENPTYVHKLYKTDYDTPNVYVELTEQVVQEKIDSFAKIFKSQVRPQDNYLSSKGMLDWARYRGIEARCEYAEAFYQYYHRI